MSTEQRSRPGWESEAATEVKATTYGQSTEPDAMASALERLDRAHAVLLRTSDGRVVTRLYRSLHSADKALSRARARGAEATVVLVELRVIGGGDDA